MMMAKTNELKLMKSSESRERCFECGLASSSLIECQHLSNSSGISTTTKICKRCIMGATTKSLSRTASLENYSVEALNLSHLVCSSDEDECPELTSIHQQEPQQSMMLPQHQGIIRKQHYRRVTPDEVLDEKYSSSIFPKDDYSFSLFPHKITDNDWEDMALACPLPTLTNYSKKRSVSPISFEDPMSREDQKKNKNEKKDTTTFWEDMVTEFFDVDNILEDRNNKKDRRDEKLNQSSSSLIFPSSSPPSKKNSVKRLVSDIMYESPNELNDIKHDENDDHRRKKIRKTVPRMWTKSDDEKLMQVVRSLPIPIKWPEVAHYFPNRSGKQCRERYLNHLNPKLVRKEWTTEEDVMIFRFYTLFGAQWAKMATFLPGRTDNNIKNRFHHVRRKLEKDVERFAKKPPKSASLESSMAQKLQAIVKKRVSERDSTSFQRKVSTVIGHVAAEAIDQRRKRESQHNGSETSLSSSKKTKKKAEGDELKFRKVDPRDMEQCRRCHLFLPSKQCGTKLNRVTHWCESCSAVPSYISRDSLYDTLWTIGQNEAKSA